jgi:hypothetical protein
MSHLIGRTDKTDKIPEIPSSVTRIEVIDERGRMYVRDHRIGGPIQVELSYQDEGPEEAGIPASASRKPAR